MTDTKKITPRRAKLYPDHVEQKYMIAKCIEFFGFMAYPDLPREECMPNPLLHPRDPNYTFAQFGDAAFQKTRLVPIPEGTPIEVETPNQTDAQQSTASDESEEYEISDSDLEDGDADFECLTDYCF